MNITKLPLDTRADNPPILTKVRTRTTFAGGFKTEPHGVNKPVDSVNNFIAHAKQPLQDQTD